MNANERIIDTEINQKSNIKNQSLEQSSKTKDKLKC